MALYPITTNIDPTPIANASITTVTVGTVAGVLLAANSSRKGFTFYNNSTHNVYLGTANTVTTIANFFAVVPPNSLYEYSFASPYVGGVFAIANGSGSICQLMELTS